MERETRRQFIKNGVRIVGGGMVAGGVMGALGITATQVLRFWTSEVPHPTVGGVTAANAKATETGFVKGLGTPVVDAASQGQSEITVSIPHEVRQAQQSIDQGEANDEARNQAGQPTMEETGKTLASLGFMLGGAVILQAANLIPDSSEPQQENNHSTAPELI